MSESASEMANKLNEQAQQQQMNDRHSSHAVEIVNVELTHTNIASEQVSRAMSRINQRAMAANMVILSTTISTNTYVLDKTEHATARPWLALTVLCQWVERSKLESMQRTNILAGGLPPRGVN